MISSAAAIGGYWTKNPSVTRAAWGTEPARSTVRFQYALVITQTRRPANSSRQAVRAAGRCQRTPAAIATRKPTWTALLNATAAGSGSAGAISARPVPPRRVASQNGRTLAGVPRPLATLLLLLPDSSTSYGRGMPLKRTKRGGREFSQPTPFRGVSVTQGSG